MDSDLLRAFVINLDRAPDRLDSMRDQLRDLPLSWQRVAAVDGVSLRLPPPDVFDAEGYRWRAGRQHSLNEIGCYLSHIKALKAFLEAESRFGLILEDDAVLGPDTMPVLAALLAEAPDWDVVKLSWFHRPLRIPVRSIGPNHQLVSLITRSSAADAYLVNRSAAAAMIGGLLPMRVPYDHAFDRAWQLGIRMFGVHPTPIRQRGYGSTLVTGVEGQTPGPKFPWWRRGSVLAYRVHNEVMRLAYYTRLGLAARFRGRSETAAPG